MKLLAHEPDGPAETDYQMRFQTARFEREYFQSQAHTLQLLEAERDRVHRMEHLLLRIENENLQLQLNQTSHEVTQAREAEIHVRLLLDSATGELDRLQTVAQASCRELDSLRHELASVNAIAADSQKLQVENVRLVKEVSSIQAEVEKLRAQGASDNNVLAEKQAITRQLNAIEVQLQTERRAHERVLAKQSQQTEEVAKLTSKLEEAQRELDLLRRHGQNEMQQRGDARAGQWSPEFDRKEVSLRNAVLARDRDQQDTPVHQHDSWGNTATKVPIERPIGFYPQKSTSRLHSELTIATPGAVGIKNQAKKISTIPGDKSAFSITPFLNRTTELGVSSTSSDDELNDTNDVSYDQMGTSPVLLANELKPTATKQLLRAGKQGSTAVNGNTQNRGKQKTLVSPNETESYSVPLLRPPGQKQALSKKRKLGLQRDKGLFNEDEDDDAMLEIRKQGRKLVGPVQTSLAGNRAFAGPLGFSPLKRDRKRA